MEYIFPFRHVSTTDLPIFTSKNDIKHLYDLRSTVIKHISQKYILGEKIRNNFLLYYEHRLDEDNNDFLYPFCEITSILFFRLSKSKRTFILSLTICRGDISLRTLERPIFVYGSTLRTIINDINMCIREWYPPQTGHDPMPIIPTDFCDPPRDLCDPSRDYTNVLVDGKWTKELKKDRPIGR